MKVSSESIERAIALAKAPPPEAERSIKWHPSRIDTLRRDAERDDNPWFERLSARGQLCASEGSFGDARAVICQMLDRADTLYPANQHFFSHLFLAGLAAQARKFLALILNEHHKAGELFSITFTWGSDLRAVYQATISRTSQCQLAIDAHIPGDAEANYFIGHWLGGIRLWSSYCLDPEHEEGAVQFNSGENGQVPGLAYCGNSPDYILVPDPYFLSEAVQVAGLLPGDKQYFDWSARIPIAFWRGSTTGLRDKTGSWRSLPRVQLCGFSLAFPNIVDAKISRIVQLASEAEREEISRSGIVSAWYLRTVLAVSSIKLILTATLMLGGCP